MKSKIGILILNYNNSIDTINCINSLETVNSSPIKVIIVDNGSNMESVKILVDYLSSKNCLIIEEGKIVPTSVKLPDFTFVQSKKNLGYAKGNKLGLKYIYADPEIDKVLIANNDILFVDDMLATLRCFEETHADTGIVSPILFTRGLNDYDYTCARKSPNDWLLLLKYILMDLSTFDISGKFDRLNYIMLRDKSVLKQQEIKVDLPSGSCMFVDKQLFRDVDDFDVNTFLYYEENILYKKLKAIGKQNYVLPSVRCIHLGASSTKAKPSYFLIRCNSESAFYYLKTYCHLNVIQMALFYLAKLLMKIKVQIFKKK